MSTLLLIILIIVIAAAGGFLGTLLEAAGWLVFTLVVLGAVVGYLVWRWVRSLRSRI